MVGIFIYISILINYPDCVQRAIINPLKADFLIDDSILKLTLPKHNANLLQN